MLAGMKVLVLVGPREEPKKKSENDRQTVDAYLRTWVLYLYCNAAGDQSETARVVAALRCQSFFK